MRGQQGHATGGGARQGGAKHPASSHSGLPQGLHSLRPFPPHLPPSPSCSPHAAAVHPAERPLPRLPEYMPTFPSAHDADGGDGSRTGGQRRQRREMEEAHGRGVKRRWAVRLAGGFCQVANPTPPAGLPSQGVSACATPELLSSGYLLCLQVPAGGAGPLRGRVWRATRGAAARNVAPPGLAGQLAHTWHWMAGKQCGGCACSSLGTRAQFSHNSSQQRVGRGERREVAESVSEARNSKLRNSSRSGAANVKQKG
jgi:hypothetical protein